MVRGVNKAQVELTKTILAACHLHSKCTIKLGERPVFHDAIYGYVGKLTCLSH